MKYDVIIIGGGPAGVSASIYLTRANKKVLLLENKKSSLHLTKEIENYYGFINPISGKELYDNGIKQTLRLGTIVKSEEVVSVSYEDGYVVKSVENTYNSDVLIIATGTSRVVPSIKGIKEFEGKGISYCATCDAFFYKNKTVGVLGSGAYALNEAHELSRVAKEVILFSNGENVINSEFKVINGKIASINGNERVDGVTLESGENITIDGLFIALGTLSSSSLASHLGIMMENNKMKVNDNYETNLPNLYAVGDAIGGILQINKAVFDGCKLANYLLNRKG